MIHTDIMRKNDIICTLFIELDRFIDMIGDKNDYKMRRMYFNRFEQYHIFIKIFDGTDDHFCFFEIQFLNKVYITDISIDAWYFIFL